MCTVEYKHIDKMSCLRPAPPLCTQRRINLRSSAGVGSRLTTLRVPVLAERRRLLLRGLLVVIRDAQSGAHSRTSPLAQLAGDATQTGRHLIAHLEVPELEVTCLVFELDLVPVFEHFRDAASSAVKAEDLRPGRRQTRQQVS